MQQYLQTTPMLDFHHPSIEQLIVSKGWRQLEPFSQVKEIYEFVRDQISFGYNSGDTLSASTVLEDGYGQCNTKGTLLMALLRGVGIHCRIHGFTIFNQLQKGAIPSYLFTFAPEKIIHSWVEVYYQGKWLEIEGYIIDKPYLIQIQKQFASQCQDFSGYGISTLCLSRPEIEWQGGNTYIQNQGIADDFGVFSSPDEFYQLQGSNLQGIRKFLYQYLLRHLINRNVKEIRDKGVK